MIKQLLVLVLIFTSVYLSGGATAFGPFFHIEAILLVFGGTFLLTWSAYSLKDMGKREPLRYADKCAIGLGALTAILDLMIHMWFEPSAADFSRKLSASLAGIFYAILLSKVILAPMAARAKDSITNS